MPSNVVAEIKSLPIVLLPKVALLCSSLFLSLFFVRKGLAGDRDNRQ